MNNTPYQAIVIGASAGGLNALTKILPNLPGAFPPAIIVVNHRMDTPDTYLTEYLAKICKIPVQDAEHLLPIVPNTIYVAPPGYHLLIADDFCFNLTVDERVNSSRPSIDVAFETAADVYGQGLIGILLTGSNSDGAAGIVRIKYEHGYTIVEDPKTAEYSVMPAAAISTGKVDFIGSLSEIVLKLYKLCDVEIKNNE